MDPSPPPSPAPVPAALGSAWTSVSPLKGESAHFTRAFGRHPNDQLIVSVQRCQCQPEELFDELSSDALSIVPDAVIARSTATACKRPAQHFVMTGVADDLTRRNLDIYAFRTSDTLVTITYSFSKPVPTAADEDAMRTVCPSESDPE